ncbi:MAG: hypothetical protein ACRDJE_12535 [Dehalococcoidia bacterium]
MTIFDLVLGENGPAWLLGAVVLAAVLTTVAAGFEILLERAGGADPTAPPDWFADHGPAVFVLGGVPLAALATIGAIILTLALGSNPQQSGLPFLVPVILNLAVFAAIICCGVGSPLAQHWGLGIAAFGIGIGAVFPLLFIANSLPFGDDGSLLYPDRLIFAIVVGLILLTQIVAGAALIALAVTSLRAFQALRTRRAERRPARLTLVGREE